MIFRHKRLILSASFVVLTTWSVVSLQANEVIVDDSFADGNRAKTGALDTSWWTSSSSSGIEDSIIAPGYPAGQLGLVTGTSGRGIHTVFPAQTLTNVGDSLTAEYTFTTPTTIDASGGNSSALRVGLFNSLGRALSADISASSGSPNELYGWGIAVNMGPGTTGLPGFMLDMDVYEEGDPNATETDLNFRRHSTDGISETGRLMATTSGFINDTSSGPDAGYTFASDTQYTGSFTVTLTATGLDLTGTLGSHTYTVEDPNYDSLTFDMLAFHTNSNKFGSSNTQGDPDNGLDFTNVTITFKAVPEPTSISLLSLVGLAFLGLRRR